MFYADNELEDLALCPKCGNRMTDPRILPCGSTLCNDCIDSQITNFNCFICNQDHSIPINGFTKNEIVSRLLKKIPHEIYRSRKVEELKSLLEKLKKTSTNLDDYVKNSENKIQQYLDSIICDIDSAAENAKNKILNKIQEYRDKLLKEIKNFQEDKDNFKQLAKNEKNKYNEAITNIENFHDKWKSYLRKFDINEDDIDMAISDTKRHINTIQRDYQECQSHIFNEKIIQFQSNILWLDDNLVGSLKYSCSPGFLDIDSFREFDLSPYENTSNTVIDFGLFSDGRIIIIWMSRSSVNFVFSIFNQDFRLTYSKIMKEIKYLDDDEVDCFGVMNNHIYCVLNSDLESISQSCYKINSSNFEIEKEVNINEKITYVSFNSKNIFILTVNFEIKIYDDNLNLINTVGQWVHKNLEYYLPKNTVYISANDNHLSIETDASEIILIDLKDGKFIRNIKIDEKMEQIYFTSDSFSVLSDEAKLRFIPHDGGKVYESSIKKVKPCLIKKVNNLYGVLDSDAEKLYLQ